ncbi:MAG: secretin N-terminal domain-containing protein, partial [Planctomycetota bacterium]
MEVNTIGQRIYRRSRYRVLFMVVVAIVLITIAIPARLSAQQDQKVEDRESKAAVQQPRGDAQQQPSTRAPAQPTPEQIRAARTQDMLKKLDPAVLNRLLGAEVQIEFVGGQIILKGPEDAVQTLELLLRSLDQEIEFPEFRVVQVTERDAKEIARTAQEALRKVFTTNNQRPEEEITITALSSNILLVSAPGKHIDFVVEIIEEIDSVPDPLGKVELMTFDVKHRRASDVATELDGAISKIITSTGGQKDKSKIQIIPNDANNTIAVTARETERAKIQLLIDTLDVEPKKGWGEVRLTVYPLLHSKAKDLAEVIKNLLSAPQQASATGGGSRPGGGGGGGAQASRTQEVFQRLIISKATPSGEMKELPPIDLQKPLKILNDDGTNSLVVATVDENVGPIGELIRLMDGVPLGEEMDIRLYPLRFADAESVKELLDKMFEQGKKLNEDPDGSGKEAVPPGNVGKSLVYNINVTTEARINTLIVSGRADQLSLVEKVIGDLDRPATSLKFPLRLIPLKYADATRLAEIITDLIDKRIETAEKTGAQKNALERERVYLTVDVRSNSLIVSASEDNHNEIVKIAEQLDKAPSSSYDQIRIVKCQRLQAKEIKDKLDELWARKTSLRTARELIEDKPVIAFDERSNLLIVASSVEDFDEIQRLVVALESQPSP